MQKLFSRDGLLLQAGVLRTGNRQVVACEVQRALEFNVHPTKRTRHEQSADNARQQQAASQGVRQT